MLPKLAHQPTTDVHRALYGSDSLHDISDERVLPP